MSQQKKYEVPLWIHYAAAAGSGAAATGFTTSACSVMDEPLHIVRHHQRYIQAVVAADGCI